MNGATQTTLKGQLVDRRRRLQSTISGVGEAEDLLRLLKDVDSALSRIDAGSYGECDVCKESVEEDFLLANPLIQYCLCTLTPAQQAVLQNDLDLAARIQRGLLPKQDFACCGWEAHFRYEPSGPVSGDYCDLIESSNGTSTLHFLVGDVSGKGVAASLLMAHMNAMMRGLVRAGLPTAEVVERANRLFHENAFSASHYVTLLSGRAESTGEVELCNAGHCQPILVRRDGEAATLDATGFPVGIVSGGRYEVMRFTMAPGETLFLYTDGLTEATDRDERDYGVDRLRGLLREKGSLRPAPLAAACLEDLHRFASGAPRTDDLTILVLRRSD